MPDQVTQLIARARQGDHQAIAELVALYERPARRVAWQILGNMPDAEDATQDGWITAWRQLASLQESGQFGGWLYRIVANVSLRKRQQRSASVAKLDALRCLATECAVDTAATLEDQQVAIAPMLDRLPAALQALSARDHLVVTLHYFAGLGVEPIAALLDLPAGTVKSRLFHARQTIRKEITMADPMNRSQHVPPDFRNVIHGMRGAMHWEPLFSPGQQGWYVGAARTWQSVSLDAAPPPWQRIPDGLIADDTSNDAGCALLAGDATWVNYELSALVTALGGGNIQLFFRACRSPFQAYVFDMMFGWQTIDIHKLEVGITGQPHLTLLSVVNYPLEHQREYAISIAVRGQSLTTYVDGALVNQVTDASIPSGAAGPNIWHGKTLFRDLKVRHAE